MSTGEKIFSGAVRLVFVAAFAAFLLASLRHIAVFFQSYEPAGADTWGSYALAWSIDGTALVLTIGLMFFGKMGTASKIFVWFFVVVLTGFSWLVNWEYAATFQSATLTSHLPPVFADINPVLASSFAFLNMAYSIIAEVFSSRPPTLDDLKKELASLTGEEAELRAQIAAAKENAPGLLDKAVKTAKKLKEAGAEIASAGRQDMPEISAPEDPEPAQNSGLYIVPSAPEPRQISTPEPPRLGMIEQAMLDKLTEAPPSEIAKFRDLAESKTLPELTEILRGMYPNYAGYITENRVYKVMQVFTKTGIKKDPETGPIFRQNLEQKAEELFSQFSIETGSVFHPEIAADLAQDFDENLTSEQDENGPATDPEISAPGAPDSGEFYGVELPADPNEDGPPTTAFEAVIGMKGQVEFTPQNPDNNQTKEDAPPPSNNAQSSAPASPAPEKKTTGLTYRDASKLPICQRKEIKAGDIRAAVQAHKISTFKDGSVSKSGVENWAKTIEKKQPAMNGH